VKEKKEEEKPWVKEGDITLHQADQQVRNSVWTTVVDRP
jgi:hypothetical protein